MDDEPLILSSLKRLLARAGFPRTETFERCLLALARLDAPGDAPELIILDLNMPGMDGPEFIRNLMERKFAGGLVLMSGEGERVLQSVQRLARAHGIADAGFLTKPIESSLLGSVVRSWISKTDAVARPRGPEYGAERLREAIDGGELELHYQPKVSVSNGAFIGVEALVRWRHPSDGLIFPDQFIATAESNGLIGRLTRAVTHGAVEQLRRLTDSGHEIGIALNVSMDNLSSLDFAASVSDAAHAAGVSNSSVTLEVTESRLMMDLRAPLETLTRLRLMRFALSIDDFGTGHSSLAQLRDIPFDELKIDRTFVHGAATDSTVRAIYSASLLLAKQLGMRIVAEGVEDRSDWDFLRQTGCNAAQGYFIGRPIPADRLEEWLPAWQARVRDELGIDPTAMS